MIVYFDASTLVPLIAPESASAAVGALVIAADTCVISDFAAAEVASAMSRLVRSAGYPGLRAQARLDEFDVWRAAKAVAVTLVSEDVREATLLVRRFELMLRAPDALHLVLAQRCGAALATLDKRMARAAQAVGLRLASFST